MKITNAIEKRFVKNHEVGKVYTENIERETFYLLIADTSNIHNSKYGWINLKNGNLVGYWYDSLEDIDKHNTADILVDAELIVG